MSIIKSINPFNQEELASFHSMDDEEIQAKILVLKNGFSSWKKKSVNFRAEQLFKLAKKLREKESFLSMQISKEMGKPLSQSKAEIEKCAWVCEYYAENAKKILEPKIVETDAKKSFVRLEAMGTILCIMPWNFPFWQFFRVLAPNLLLGNVLLLKHASNVSLCSNSIQELFLELKLDFSICENLIIETDKITSIISQPSIKGITLTGSEKAGSSVAEISGREIKKTVLELGGSNALIILEDANLEKYIDEIVWARFQNAGQSCIAAKRYLVHEKIYEKFKSLLLEKMEKLSAGNPLEETSLLGPLAKESLAIELEKQIQDSINLGATLLKGGRRDGAFFESSLIEIENTQVPVFQEETFGPLAVIKKFSNNAEAIQLSNQSDFGLGVSIFTENHALALEMSIELEEGAVFINSMVKSDPRLPFGGIKKSGYGRELGEEAMKEFANVKTIYVK